MMKALRCILVFVVLISEGNFTMSQPASFIKVRDHRFRLNNKPYYFIGANMWYAGFLTVSGNTQKGKERLEKELDFLKSKGVTNLRIIAGGEGEGKIDGVSRIEPSLQPAAGVFDQNLLKGLDLLLVELGKRNMNAIIFLSNNWEWSGGFLQYLNWNHQIPDSILQRKLSWDEMRDYVSSFYSCKKCRMQYEEQVKLVVQRTNTITKRKYKDDPAIMAWEIANEPRPMRPSAISAYKEFISHTASLIKSLDKNHLVTTGSEGEMGSENLETFTAIHSDKNIDYATIHIWPKNWSWFRDTAIAKDLDKIMTLTTEYINKHTEIIRKINKPLVIEEFGLPRDGHSYSLLASTTYRDKYYTGIFGELLANAREKKEIGGANFWAFGGSGRPSYKQLLWKKGDDLIGDPPVEEQGLNSVFDSDTSTWDIISLFAKKLSELP